jgi:hypothetical protein
MSNNETSPVVPPLARHVERRQLDEAYSGSLDHVRAALERLQFGEVTLNVQDGVIVQINRMEKLRVR